jgi:hypothetical protein
MDRSRFLIGTIMLVTGFILYQLGLSSELHPTTLLAQWLAEFAKSAAPWSLSPEVIAVMLQLTGGLLAIFGLIVCFAGVARPNGTRFQSRPMDPARTRPTRTVTNCKFCGVEIRPGSSFCPSCKKSQA